VDVEDNQVLRVLCILGTRPEAIKMAPVIKEMERYPGQIISRVCVTAQHRQMIDQVLSLFRIVPHYDLDLMQQSQVPVRMAATALSKLEPILMTECPDWVLIQGDTTTAMAASIAAFYARVKVGHIEAGLRTYDKTEPFPEEINRRIAGTVADLHFAPTKRACENLLRENVPAENILLTGNPVVDALFAIAEFPYDFDSGPLTGIPRDKRILLVTAHRRENFGQPLETICRALRRIADSYHSSAHIVYPVHPNPNVWVPVHRMLASTPGITLLPPLSYLSLIKLLKQSYLVLTDSGGLQEEAPCLGKPVLILRNTTERPEAVEAGTSRLVGVFAENIVDEAARLLDNEQAYRQMARVIHCYGDGKAAERIVSGLLKKEKGDCEIESFQTYGRELL
jgi:UDP-N-acetylglucosamine 2-epimerase (non-hydrolysing)